MRAVQAVEHVEVLLARLSPVYCTYTLLKSHLNLQKLEQVATSPKDPT